MTDELDGLLRWAGRLSGSPSQVRRLGATLLQAAPDRPGERPWDSVLNNDGAPLQACATFGPRGRRLRLIGDPTGNSGPRRERAARARRAIRETLAASNAEGLAALCELTLRRELPRGSARRELDPGLVWLAADLQRGAALYVNQRWGDAAARWDDALGWLRAVLPDARAATSVVAALRPHATLASVALEGSSAVEGRAKLYWRLMHPIGLDALGVAPLCDPAAGAFLGRIVGEAALPLQGLVLSAGFDLADGALADAKIDLCAHCLPRTSRQWLHDLAGCCKAFGLAEPELGDGLDSGACEMAFLGLGIDRRGERRINAYLKPALRCAGVA
jgi:hypothetical protein